MVLVGGVATVPTSRTTMECFEDHADLLEAFRSGAPGDAAGAMRRHILNTATLLIRQEARHRPDFDSGDGLARLTHLIT
jgi:DNA-binding GntR family transcriptional regulator